jgi:hypothetical protein
MKKKYFTGKNNYSNRQIICCHIIILPNVYQDFIEKQLYSGICKSASTYIVKIGYRKNKFIVQN